MRRNKAFFLAVIAFVMTWFPLQASTLQRGDINRDGSVNITDVTLLINGLMSESFNQVDVIADINGDGAVNVSDVTMLINYLINDIDLPYIELQYEDYYIGNAVFTMVRVDGGSFMMGGTAEQGNDPIDREKPVHQVTLSTYYIGQTEVTQALWQEIMGNNPSNFPGSEHPVEQVSWEDCQEFIAILNDMTGQAFRLPTEAEWEYAARGGIFSDGYKYAGSNELYAVAWYSYNDSWQLRGYDNYGTHTVATRMPNELDLYDMSGNVHEWCNDWYGNYSGDAQFNPIGPASGTNRIYRGGSWYFDEWFCRVSFRNGLSPSYRSYGIGLRLAM